MRRDSLLRHQITCHPSACATTVARNYQECQANMLMVHGAGRPSQIIQDRYLASLMAWRWISCNNCYITFNTKFSFKEHMKSGAHLLVTGTAGVNGGSMGEVMLLLGRSSVGEWQHIPCKYCDLRFDCCQELVKHTSTTQKERERGLNHLLFMTRLFPFLARPNGSAVTKCLSARIVAKGLRPATALTDTSHRGVW